MSIQERDEEVAVIALNAAIEAGLVVHCPLHHPELVALGDGEAVPATVPVEIRGRVIELLTSMPKACPRCAEESE